MLLISVLMICITILFINSEAADISYNQPKFCANVSWNANATTVPGYDKLEFNPYGIFITTDNTVYVTGKNPKNLIQVWLEGCANPTKTIEKDLSNPISLFVLTPGDIYVNYDDTPDQVTKWSLNSTNSSIVSYFTRNCAGLFIDINDNLYCSMKAYHQVIKGPLNSTGNISTIVAGVANSPGDESYKLNSPHGIFVDIHFTLYIADCNNNRIQSFTNNCLQGTTVVGKSTGVNLTNPTGIVLDGNGYLFIVDEGRDRIVGFGPNGFRCLVGCSVGGSQSNQLSSPYSLSFDSGGNLFVTDTNNRRIQKFLLATNSCSDMVITQSTVITSNCPTDTTTSDIQTTATSTFTLATSFTTAQQTKDSQSPQFFVPTDRCPDKYIGLDCTMSSNPCETLQPCQNGSCYNNNTFPRGYICSCPSGYEDTHCKFDHPPCEPNPCWNNGTCNVTSNNKFNCTCGPGWEGENCEAKINYCVNVSCENQGVCRPLHMNYTCECVGDSYFGRHCEIIGTKIIIYKIVSKSFAYIAIIAIISVAIFIIIMDILKYCFGIDPVDGERERIRRKKRAKKRKLVIQRFIYVNAPHVQPSLEEHISTQKETSV